jgi:hypothetical protein
MKAEFIYEKFTDESDPIRDMGIGMKSKYEKYSVKTVLTLTDREKIILKQKFFKLSLEDLYFLGDDSIENDKLMKKLYRITKKNNKIIEEKIFVYRSRIDSFGNYQSEKEKFIFYETRIGKILVIRCNSNNTYIGDLNTAVNVDLLHAGIDDEIL